tara:strand:- start:496 stop:969 length:474 start_codon:yes stop_codon:yes gene_type:complete
MTAVAESPWQTRDASEEALLANVKPAPLAALREVQDAFADHNVWAWPDGSGGVHVVIEEVALGAAWAKETSWLGFTINYLYPDADTYPHYVRADLTRTDGTPLIAPFNAGNTFQEQPAVMVSRSSPNRVSGLSTASRKALSVVAFIQSQPATHAVAP